MSEENIQKPSSVKAKQKEPSSAAQKRKDMTVPKGETLTCVHHGKALSVKNDNFYVVNKGSIFKGLNYIPVCKDCVRKIYANYYHQFGKDYIQALYFTCRKLDVKFDLTMCNPPFHASMDEATKGSERKWRALGKADPKRKLPVLNFGGQSADLWCEGGEARFVTQLIAESAHFAHKVLWFSTLVSKASNLPAIETALKTAPGAGTQPATP